MAVAVVVVGVEVVVEVVVVEVPTNTGSRVGDKVLSSLDEGDFDKIMLAIEREPQYQGLTAEVVLRNIPRGLCTHPDDPAWLSCR